MKKQFLKFNKTAILIIIIFKTNFITKLDLKIIIFSNNKIKFTNILVIKFIKFIKIIYKAK